MTTVGAFTIKRQNPPPEGTYLGDLWARTSELTLVEHIGPYDEHETIITRA